MVQFGQEMWEKKHFESRDVTSMTSWGHVTSSVTAPFDSPYPLSYRLPIVTDPLSSFVSEIFYLKVADIHTLSHTHRTSRRLTIRVA